MKKAPFAISLIAAGLLAAGGAVAGEYDAWRSVSSDDDVVKISDSFSPSQQYSTETTKSDDDVTRDSHNRTRQSSKSDDDTLSIAESFNRDWRSSSDDDTTVTKTSDDDYTSSVDTRKHVEKHWTNTEDNSVEEDNDVALDFQLAMPEMNSYKKQDQHAGHQSETAAYGEASGHSVGVQGGTNMISAGNEKTYNAGPVFAPVNVNSLPVTTIMTRDNYAPIRAENTVAGGSVYNAPKTVVGPVGNQEVFTGGNVGQSVGASTEQEGNSLNGNTESFRSDIR